MEKPGIRKRSEEMNVRCSSVWKKLSFVVAFVASACASIPQQTACALPESDRLWAEQVVEAWRFTSREITGISSVPSFQGVFFSADCTVSSGNALTIPPAGRVKWTATPHHGTITLPDGSEIPAAVTSYVSGEKGSAPYFVMAAPSVWKAAGIAEAPGHLIPVMLHEASHVAQTATYGPRIGALIEANHLPDSFNDNAVQERFKTNAEFAASVDEEIRLFAEAVAAKDDVAAKSLAREALRRMRERQARWMVGADAYLAEAEDVWLTFEGSGQWVGYQWLVHPKGGAQKPEEVIDRFIKGRHWSQTEGFVVVMALDRIAGPGWKKHAFGDGEKTVLQMLDEALAE
jgi:hypothetical protein